MKNLIYSVTQINNQTNSRLSDNFSNIWIKGQIASFKHYPSGHLYFTLKDSKSELQCVFFNYNKSNITEILEKSEIVARGDISIYPSKGKYQFVVSSIIKSGESELWFEFVELKNKLQKEGIFDIRYKQDIPLIPENIAIITSNEGAVVHDIQTILNRRAPYINIYVFDVPIQGDIASTAITSSLSEINKLKYIDLIIIARGGGSMEDFKPFNKENVIKGIFNSKIPVLTAIGHRIDTTLSDFSADKSVATPSEAAEVCCISRSKLYNNLDVFKEQLENSITGVLRNKMTQFNNLHIRSLSKNPKLILSNLSDKVHHTSFRLNELLIKRISYYGLNINNLYSQLSASNIDRIKRKGFAIIRNKNKKMIRSVSDVAINNSVYIELSDGKIISKIIRKIK